MYPHSRRRGGIAGSKVEAASGKWVLTKEIVYIDGYYDQTKNIEGDGSKELSVSTTRDDKAYAVTGKYLGKFDGSVRMLNIGGFYGRTNIGSGYEDDYCDKYMECTIPASSYAEGASFSLKLHSWVENLNGQGNLCGCTIAAVSGRSGRNWGNSTTSQLKDSDGNGYYYVGLKSSDNKLCDNMKERTVTVSGKMPEGNKEGDT